MNKITNLKTFKKNKRRKGGIDLAQIENLEVDGVDSRDYPDFCDAYFCSGNWIDGKELSDGELDQLAEEYPDILNEMAYESFIP